MERGYLVATLAIVAVFTGMSHGFRSLENMSWLHVRHFGAIVGSRCDSSRAAAEKLKTRLRPRIPEEAQLLAEMNVPTAESASSIAEQMGRQDRAISQCARARALQEAERARREAWQMQREARNIHIEPLSLEVYLPQDLDRRIQARTAAATAQIAASNLRLQMMADRLNTTEIRLSGMESSAFDSSNQAMQQALSHMRCKIKVAQQVREAMSKVQCNSAPE